MVGGPHEFGRTIWALVYFWKAISKHLEKGSTSTGKDPIQWYLIEMSGTLNVMCQAELWGFTACLFILMCQVGPNKGNKSGGVFSSVKNSLAVCPGDPPASGENGDYCGDDK